MPIYEYACIECDTKNEISRKVDEQETIPTCISCGYRMMRVYSAPGISFKGSGFYKTDNG
jgi:putative FmdB family regulatory protein